MTRTFALALLASTALLPVAAQAQQLPSGGQVAAGSATIGTASGGAMTITQGSDRAVINWHDFSVGAGGKVDILQPNAGSALLNRVTGTATSTIAGQINANGQVFLVNPNGILITPTGSVKAAGFVASTLDLGDSAFMNGEITVSGRGGSVVNQGTISIVKGGYAALIGGKVDNSGLILAPLGKVALGAGTRATLDLEGDGFLQVALPASDSGITMSGRIVADGGAVVISAAQAVDAARSTVNLSGVIEARGFESKGGTVVLTGDAIQLTGASIDVSGALGGTVLIGGERQGKGTLAHAQTLTVDAASSIKADATGAGNGGEIVLWSDQRTDFAGTISARGAGTGNGGNAEVSSAGLLKYTGLADLRGSRFGTLLLDPYNFVISNDAGSDITADNLQNQLSFGNLSIGTIGDITISAPLTWSNSTLTLYAENAIAINAPITIGGSGGLDLTAGSTTVGGFSLLNLTFGNGAGISYTAAPNSGQSLSINGEAYTLLYSMSDLAGLNNATGRYALANNLTASGTYSTALIPTFGGTLEGLGHTISNLRIAGANSNAGLIGAILQTGTVRDIGLTGLSLNASGGYAGGLAAFNSGVVTNAFVNGSINIVANNAGGLVGYNNAGLVTNVYSAGSVTANGNVGGIVGWAQGGLVSNAYSTAALTGNSAVGGIVGTNNGSIVSTYATGTINGTSGIGGGLVGSNGGSVQSSYWDIGTTGRSTSPGGGTGLTTAQLQSGSASGLGSAFAGGANGLYPYLASFFPSGVQVISGTAYTNSGAGAANAIVNLYSGGSLLAGGTLATAANGYYYTILPVGTLVDGSSIGQTLTLSGASAISGVDYRDGLTVDGQGNLGGLSVRSGRMNLTTSRTLISDLVAGVQATMGPLASLDPDMSTTINATGRFAFDVGFAGPSGTNDLTVNTGGDLELQANTSLTGRNITLNAGGNFINLAGASALNASSRWLVYLPDALGNTYGGLDSQNTAIWATERGTNVSASGNRYVFDEIAGTLVFTPASTTKIYGDTFANFNGTVSGLRQGVSGAYQGDGGINWTGSPVFNSSGLAATAGVGTYAITLSGLTGINGYSVDTSATGTLSVLPRLLTIAVDPLSRLYGNANPTLTYTVGGLVNGDTLSGALATSATTTSNVGSYAISQGSLSAGSNYVLAFSGADLTVTPRSLTVTADAISRLYGNANPALTYTLGGDGLVGSDTLSGALATAAGATSNVGSYAIGQGTLSAGGNYTIAYNGADLTVTPRSLTVTADALSRLYGNANPALTYSLGGDGLAGSDTLSGALATAAGATSNVGGYAISQGTLSAGGNYALSFTGAYLTVTPRSLTVTADALSRLYGNANPALTYTLGGDGLAGSDTLSGALATSATTTSNVGSYAINQGTLSAGGNYALTFTGAYLTVTPRSLTVTADARSRLYGNANPALTYTLGGDGLVGSDTLSGALSTGASGTSNVGSYAINQGTLSAGGNYALSFSGADLTVTPRSLTVTADAISRLYGNANPALTYTLGGDGLVGSDTLSGALATAAGATSNVGSYAINPGTLSAGGNYALSFTGANLTVTPRSLTVTADALSRLYGNANPALTYTLGGDGLAGSDTLSGALATSADATSNVGSYAISQGSLSAGSNYILAFSGADLTLTPRSLTVTADAISRLYGNANPALTYALRGDGLVNGDSLGGALATDATGTSNVGKYAIDQGSLSAGSNYTLAFTGADLTVTPRGLTVTADALSRLYGNANPALTYTLGGDGLVNGDSLSGILATGATGTSNVGKYAIDQGSLSAGGNYTLAFTGADLTVTPRSLTVTADALSRLYGNANPALTYALGGDGLVNGDSLSGALATDATGTSNVGKYAIDQGSLSAGGNYTLTFTGADLTVTPRGLTVTADAISRLYGNANPALTYTLGGDGLVNGDSLSGVLATGATGTSNVGKHAIDQGSLSAGGNYTLAFTGADLTVTPRGLTVTADALSRLYGNANPALTYTLGGDGLVNGDSLSGALATEAVATSNVGSYAIAQGTLSAGENYTVTYDGADLTVTPRSPGSTAGNLLPYIFTPNLRPATNLVTLSPAKEGGSDASTTLVSCQMQGGVTCSGK
jgi:filamentous hemagglutinin family protein